MCFIGSISLYVALLVPVFSQASSESEVWLECTKTCGGGVQCRQSHVCRSNVGRCCSQVYKKCNTQACPPPYAAAGGSSYQGSPDDFRRPQVASYQNQQYTGSRYPYSGNAYNYQQQSSQGGIPGYFAAGRRGYALSDQGGQQQRQQRMYLRRSSVLRDGVRDPRPVVSRQTDYGALAGARVQSVQQPRTLPLHRQNVGQAQGTGAPQGQYQAGLLQSIPLLNARSKQSTRARRVFTRHDAYNARVKQCTAFNDKPYGEMKETFEWVPCATSGAYRECELSCLAKNFKFCAPLARTVEDGTPCYSDLTKVCIDGKCQTPPEDCEYKDGRCLPRAAAAQRRQVVHGTFQPQNMKLGYNPVITIPTGSTNINITELKRSRNYLALKDHNGGKYYINGKWFIDSPQVFRCAGTLFTYTRPRIGGKGESLTANGPTQKALDVMLIYQKERTQISYSYTLPVDFPRTAKLSADASADAGPEYEWRETGYSPCTRTCAGGKQQTLLRCVSISDGKATSDSNCPEEKPAIREKVCNLQPCPPSWAPQLWTQCSVTCGIGIQTRNVLCKQLVDKWGKPLEIIVPIVMCSGPRPPLSQQCKMMSCDQVHQWLPRQWSQCSVSCDKGSQTRSVDCMNKQTNATVQDSLCNSKPKPQVSQPCNAGSCKTVWFAEHSWSPCSFDCGDGLQGRKVFCATAEGQRVPDERCDQTKKPTTTKKCNLGNCQAIWLASPWGKCSAECGDGIQTRVVACAGLVGGTYQEFPETACPMASKPPKQQPCTRSNCKPQWFSTEWSECSQSCNGGVQTRLTICRNLGEQGPDGCSSLDRPKSRRSCNTQPCPRSKTSLAGDVRRERNAKLPTSCRDWKNRVYCSFVTKSSFCRYAYYRDTCCASCSVQLSTHR